MVFVTKNRQVLNFGVAEVLATQGWTTAYIRVGLVHHPIVKSECMKTVESQSMIQPQENNQRTWKHREYAPRWRQTLFAWRLVQIPHWSITQKRPES
jgi:hypothetical protein